MRQDALPPVQERAVDAGVQVLRGSDRLEEVRVEDPRNRVPLIGTDQDLALLFHGGESALGAQPHHREN
eukprot:14932885-Alexandrium_andersonii.AAC.1